MEYILGWFTGFVVFSFFVGRAVEKDYRAESDTDKEVVVLLAFIGALLWPITIALYLLALPLVWGRKWGRRDVMKMLQRRD